VWEGCGNSWPASNKVCVIGVSNRVHGSVRGSDGLGIRNKVHGSVRGSDGLGVSNRVHGSVRGSDGLCVSNRVHGSLRGSDGLQCALKHQCEEERPERVPLAYPSGGYNVDCVRRGRGETAHHRVSGVH
jgi:hypothetical protein